MYLQYAHVKHTVLFYMLLPYRCGNVAAILELDEHLKREFTIFEAAPQVGFYHRGNVFQVKLL